MAGQPLTAAQLEELKAGLGVAAPVAMPVTQNSIDSLNKSASADSFSNPVQDLLGTPVAPVAMPEKESPTPGSREVTEIKKPDGTEIKKIKDTVAEKKNTAPSTANGDFIPAGAIGAPTGGMKNAEASKSTTTGTTASRLVDLPPDVLAAYDALRAQREAQITDAQGAARDFTTSYEPRTDMSALLSFFGSQTGRDYMSGYKKPGGLNELVGIQDKLEENIAKAKTGLSDTELQYLKARMGLQETTKTSTTDSNKELDAALLANKIARGDGLAGEKFDDQKKRDESDKMKEFLNTKEFGKTLDAQKKMFEASANVNKVLYNRNGVAPFPGTPEAKQFAAAAAQLVFLVNQYDADLGALAAADAEYLNQYLGFKTQAKFAEFLESNYSPGLLESVRRYQDQLKDANSIKLQDVRDTYQAYPNILKAIDRKESGIKESLQDMELSRVGKGKGQTQSKKSADDEVYDNLSPEDKARVDALIKAGG